MINNLSALTIITTDKCSAACTECCFKCSPKKNNLLSFEQIKKFVDKSLKDFDNIKLVVFTGGECTLLGEDLFKAIKYCTEKKLETRIVTNAYWAKSKKTADKFVKKLVSYGLSEINFSTGDNHQEFVPFDSVVNAIEASVENELYALVNIEKHDKSIFSVQDAYSHPDILELMRKGDYSEKFRFVESVWLPFHNENILEYKGKSNRTQYKGCDTLFDFLGLFPKNEIKLCCGLTVDYIDSMNLGNLDNLDLKEIYAEQFNDFLKIWIYVDGAEKIYDFVMEKDDRIKDNPRFVHPCQYCAEIYNNDDIKRILSNTWQEKVDEVMFRYEIKKKRKV